MLNPENSWNRITTQELTRLVIFDLKQSFINPNLAPKTYK